MVIVTRTVCVPEVVLTLIRPVHTRPTVSPDWLTETAKVVLAGPARKVPDGETVSQAVLVQLCSETCAVALV